MAVEIEHKYLVANDAYRQRATEVVEIEQGYLCREKNRTVRVRMWGDRAFLTVKGCNTGDSRLEFEYEIPLADARQMMALCPTGTLSKTRYMVPVQNLMWEVDEFHGPLQGLVIAEVELPSSHTPYVKPVWVGKDVTADPYYYNSNLIVLCSNPK